MATAPRNPHAIVLIGGDRYDSWVNKQLIKGVRVELCTDQNSEATFKVFDPDFAFIDKYTSEGGVPPLVCKFYLGFGEDLGEPLFTGLLSRVERNDTDSILTVYDMGIKMKQERKGEYHNNKHDLEILRKLATRNGLLFEGPDEAPALERHKANVHVSKNDWEHSRQRARQAGLVTFVRHDTFFAKLPAKVGGPLISLTYRKDFDFLHQFDCQYKLPENQYGRPRLSEYRGRKRGGRRLTGRSTAHSRGTVPVQLTEDLAIHTPLYAKRRAQAHKDLQRDPAFTITVRSIPPLPGIRPDVRDTIALAELGKLFSGAYLIDKIVHELTGDSFTTEYSLYRDIDA